MMSFRKRFLQKNLTLVKLLGIFYFESARDQISVADLNLERNMTVSQGIKKILIP